MISNIGFLYLVSTLILCLQILPLMALQAERNRGEDFDNDSITILNPIDETDVEVLPSSALIHASTWVLKADSSFFKIPDTMEGYVDPVSMSLLWQPVDLQYPNLQLALGIHIRNGRIRHLFPAIDISYTNGEHRNRGLDTVPRAHTWISIYNHENSGVVDQISLLSSFQLELASRNTKTNEKDWTTLDISTPIKEAVERLIYALAGSPPAALGEGSHFIHILLPSQKDILCPNVGHEIRAVLHGPEKMENSTGILNVKVAAAQAGSKSKHLPPAYEALFHDSRYQRSEYVQFQKRREARRQEDKEGAARRLQERKQEL